MKFKRLYFSLIICIGISSIGNSKIDSLFFSRFKPQEKSSLFLFTGGYRMPLNKNLIINSGRGLYFEAGINPGNLISNKIILGCYAGWGFMDRLWNTSFRDDFARDYSSSIKSDLSLSSLDSAVISSSSYLIINNKGKSSLMPGCQMNSFNNYSLYYGVIIKLPYKYTPVLKLYIGTTRSHFMGAGNLATQQKDYNIFQLRRKLYGCELVFFRGLQGKSKDQSRKYPLYYNAGTLSFYYEVCDFYKSTLYFDDGTQQTNIPLYTYTSNSFLQKYKKEVAFGLKFSFSIM